VALAAARDALTAVFREEAGRLTASVMRVLGDFDVAEEVVQDALLAAWQQGPVDGIPKRPGAWLWTVARRRAVDLAGGLLSVEVGASLGAVVQLDGGHDVQHSDRPAASYGPWH
jgi:DNA-directed RNA polymerase specialized sigma24 family protein